MKNIYWQYFKYVIEHKKNVFIECWKEGLYLHAFTHDMSKFLPCEFIPYAKWFYEDYGIQLEKDYGYERMNDGRSCLSREYLKRKHNFEKAWEHHYKHNKHHWDYWVDNNMPINYIRQMICDWAGMSRKFGDSAQEYYLKHYEEFNMTRDTRFYVEANMKLYAPGQFTCECDDGYWQTVKEVVESSLEWEKRNNQESNWLRNECLPYYKNKYNIDLLEVLNLSKD